MLAFQKQLVSPPLKVSPTRLSITWTGDQPSEYPLGNGKEMGLSKGAVKPLNHTAPWRERKGYWGSQCQNYLSGVGDWWTKEEQNGGKTSGLYMRSTGWETLNR